MRPWSSAAPQPEWSQRDQKPAAPNYGCEEPEEHDRGRCGPGKGKTALEESDHWEKHVRQHARPDKWPHDVSGAIDDVERSERE